MFYKVVGEGLAGQLVSWSGMYDSPNVVEYRIGEWVTTHPVFAAHGFHLCVFDSLDAAKDLAIDAGKVFECECEEEVKLPALRLNGVPYRVGIFTAFMGGDYEYCPITWWPVGTRMFKRVKLVKEVECFTKW